MQLVVIYFGNIADACKVVIRGSQECMLPQKRQAILAWWGHKGWGKDSL